MRDSTRETCTTDHLPPRAAGMRLLFSSAAIWLGEVLPSLWMARINGSRSTRRCVARATLAALPIAVPRAAPLLAGRMSLNGPVHHRSAAAEHGCNGADALAFLQVQPRGLGTLVRCDRHMTLTPDLGSISAAFTTAIAVFTVPVECASVLSGT
jgi:hypothetical protein